MADVREGLSVGEESGLDPNNTADFEKILEGRGVAKEAGEGLASSTDIRSGLTTEEPSQAREPANGRFVAKETPAVDTSATDSDTSEVDEATTDPKVAAFLAKYDGDSEKALKAAAHQDELVGRQGQELGELRSTREEVAELRGQVKALLDTRSAAPVVTLSTEQVAEQVETLIGSEGYFAAATKAANIAAESKDERVYRAVMEQWQLESPMDAMDFNTDFRLWQREERAKAESKPSGPEPWMVTQAEQHRVAGIGAALTEIAAEFDPEDWGKVSEQFDAAMESMPKNVLEMVGSNDAEARSAGVRLVVDRATLLANKAGASAPAVEKQKEAAAAVQRKLTGSRVASSALKPAAAKGSKDSPSTREEVIADFKRQIVETETTNIASGLTYAK